MAGPATGCLQPQTDDRLRRLQVASRRAGALVFAAGLCLGAAWAGVQPFGVLRHAAGDDGMLAAVAFSLAGISLALAGQKARWLALASRSAALAVLMISMASGIALVFEFSGWPGAGFLPGWGPAVGILSPQSALAFLMAGMCLSLLTWWPHSCPVPDEWLALSVFALPTLALLGHIYNLSQLYRLPAMPGMSAFSATTMLVFGLGILMARPDKGLPAIYLRPTAGGHLLRRLLPAAIIVPPGLSWLFAAGQRRGFYEPTSELSYVGLAYIAVAIGLLIWTAASLDRMDRALIATQARAARAEAAAELARLKDHFLSCISHEIKTPLAQIIGAAELLEDGSACREVLPLIHDGARRLTEHISAILEYSALVGGGLDLYSSEVCVPELVCQATREVASIFAEKRVSLDVRIDDGLQPVTGDSSRIFEILRELLDNARKFTPTGRSVGVEVSGSAGKVRIAICDSGCGIPTEQIESIWAPFRARKGQSPDGLGLGLARARALARLHGGDIKVESREGRGSRFTLELLSRPPESMG